MAPCAPLMPILMGPEPSGALNTCVGGSASAARRTQRLFFALGDGAARRAPETSLAGAAQGTALRPAIDCILNYSAVHSDSECSTGLHPTFAHLPKTGEAPGLTAQPTL